MSQMGVYGVGAQRAARSSGASGSDTQESLSFGPMAYITGKQAFLQILKQEGVSVMFGNPGTAELPLMDGLAREPGIHYVDLDKPLIDFVGLARSLGVPGTRVEKTSDIGPAVGKALASGGPHLVDVRIDPAFA